ncbi:MAG: GMC family oxidoreductase [Pseudomonadota bacterium]
MLDDVPKDPDICVIGAGVAGLVFARKLADTGLNILLVESGDRTQSQKAQSLNAGRSNLTDYPFAASRARVFGGTSTRWYGACVQLDPTDFETRSWMPSSGWPLKASDLASYVEDARADFGLGPEAGANLNRPPFEHPDLQAKTVGFSAPLDLGQRYEALIAKSTTVHCMLNGTVTNLVPDSEGKRITSIWIAVEGKSAQEFAPGIVVLACGGIENARLLLASNSVHPKGVGNGRDVVGRYHMEHPIRTVGVLPIGNQAASMRVFTDQTQSTSGKLQGTFGLSAEARAREGLMDLHLRCYRYSLFEDEEPIIEGKRALFEAATVTERLRRVASSTRPVTLRYLSWHTRNKIIRRARFTHLRLMAFVEQEPDPDNRLTLSRDKDAFGSPLPYLEYTESAEMTESVRRSMETMATALSEVGFPGLRHDEASLAHLKIYDDYGLHPMGGTRMSENPRYGVVDKDCRVHEFANLFVAGSSVFPTGGAANPTWTIAALALRLAETIHTKFRTT